MTMAEEPEIPIPTQEPRLCPACGSRVAAMATTCLMCGASLVEKEAAPEEEEVGEGKLPGWVRALIVVALALLILSAGSFGFYKLMTATPRQPTPTTFPTRTPTQTHTPTPSQTPTSTSTPTPVPPLAYQVREGQTLIDIAIEQGTTVEAILALNPDLDPDLLQVGQVILIPVPTPTPGPTATLDPSVPTPTLANYIIYTVKQGDTLSTIAEEYGKSVELLIRVNDLDGDTIFPNQSLIIPMGTPEPSPTPTVNPNATPTPIPPYPAPDLLNPPDGAVLVKGEEPTFLQWASVSVLRGDEWYALTLFREPGDVVVEKIYTRATAWRVPPDLLVSASDSGSERLEFRWQVRVVRETRDRHGQLTYQAAGAPSEPRTFTWLLPTPTPIPTSTPTPTP